MKQETDKIVGFELAAVFIVDEAQSCEVRPVICTCKQISLCFLTGLLDKGITQVRYRGNGLQIWIVAANILNKE
jgi:hypothetical protein